ncbi:MAG: pre-peptidase C-terminal domain-containing protein [Planctomycetes bacterium]|nr:pre-peptidase C-terminal domain-containing protein [Planctomycetota bacterium]
MDRTTRALPAGILLLLVPGASLPAPPVLKTVYPPAARRGTETQLQLVGGGFTRETRLVLPFAAEVRGGGSNSDVAVFSLKPAADTPPGVYPVRVQTAEGISNLRLIAVTDVPVILAKGPNGSYRNGRLRLERAQRIEWPCAIAGGRLVPDVDAFRFSVKAGQRLVFVTETWRLGLTPDPLLRLRDARGRTLAYAHDTPGLQRDERIDYTFAKAGEYILELQSTGGTGWTNHYLVRLGEFDYARAVFPLGGRRGEMVPFRVVGRDGKTSTVKAKVPADPWADHWRLPLGDHAGSLPWLLASGDLPEISEDEGRDGPQKVAWPVTVNGRVGKPGEEDLYRIAVKPGEHVRVQVEAYFLGSRLDGYLMVYDPAGKKLLAKNDDQVYRGNPDPALSFEVPKGVREVVISLRDCMGGGGIDYGYRLTIERGGPDFYLWLGKAQNGFRINEENEAWFRTDASDTLNLPVGQEVRLRVSVRRSAKENDPYYAGPVQGYQGPIRLKAEGAPRGVTFRPAIIPAGKTEGEMVCVAAAETPKDPFEVVIVGEGTRDDGSVIRRVAERKLFLSDPQMIHLSWNWRMQKLVCVTAREGR